MTAMTAAEREKLREVEARLAAMEIEAAAKRYVREPGPLASAETEAKWRAKRANGRK